MPSSAPDPIPGRAVWLWLALSLGAGLLMIHSGSLWIDEGQTLRFARQPDFGSWWKTLRENTYSEAQMPLSMFLAWAGVQVLGDGEWQLRAANLVWVGLAGLAAGLIGWRLQNRLALPLLLLHPFLWYYANEARPYALQIAAGAWLLYLLLRWRELPEIAPAEAWAFLGAAVIGYGSSLLFAFPLFGFCVLMAWQCFRLRRRPRLRPAAVAPLALALAALALLTVYYLETLQRGAGGARLWKVGSANLLFAFYELLGYSGLGPPRHELRELALHPSLLLSALMQPRAMAGLGGLSAVYAALAWRLWKRRGDATVRMALALALLGAGALFAGAAVMQFPFWGRHLAPLLPAVALAIALAAAPAGLAATWPRRALCVALLAGLAASSLTLRFDQKYAKDDYRGAAAIARRALDAGQIVWWSADPEECAQYYRLTNADKSARAGLFFALHPTAAELAARPRPDVVIQSKPDVFDTHRALTAYLSTYGFQASERLTAFVIWTRPAAQTNAPGEAGPR